MAFRFQLHRDSLLYRGFRPLARLALGALTATTALYGSAAEAHTQGVSLASVTVAENGSARLELGLATTEIARLVPIDRNGDGHVSEAELGSVHDSLVKILPGTFDVVADGKRCSPKFDVAKLAEPSDGVDIIVVYTCSPKPRDVAFRSHLAPAMAPGHRLVATLSTPSRTQSRVLGSSEPECVLHTEWEPDTRQSARLQYGICAGIVLGLALVYAVVTRRKKPATMGR